MEVKTQTLVIGAGPGGYVAAIRAAQLGQEVTIIDKNRKLGGVCLNWGCIPTKALIKASNYYAVIQELEEMGIRIKDYSLDFKSMKEWKGNIINKLEKGIRFLLEKHDVEILRGKAVFTNENTIRVEGQSDVTSVTFDNCIVSTGSSSIEIPGFNFEDEHIVRDKDLLSLETVPKRLIIIGGGYIGTEMATVFTKLGSQVEIIEMGQKILPILTKDMTDVVQKKLENKGVKFHTNAEATRYLQTENGVEVKLKNSEEKIVGDKILVVVGRKPNTKGIGLEKANIEVDSHGFVKTNQFLKTTNKRIYAIGDIQGNPMLAHKASRQGKVAAEIISGKPSAYDNKVVPAVVFNDPEMAQVGLSEDEAKKRGYEVAVGKYPFKNSGKALIEKKTSGFVKVIADKKTDIILGVEAVGPHVSDVIGEAALAMEMGATSEDVASTIHPHPTNSEGLMEAAEDVTNSCVHIYRS